VTTEALLIMDVQNGTVDHVPERAQSLLATLAETARAARTAGVTIIYVRIAFRLGTPEVSPKNRSFSSLAGSSSMSELNSATEVHPAIAPLPGDIIVTKRRVSAFSGSDLDVVLRSLGVDSLVLTGIATSGVVLSTVRQAADLDFNLTVLRDGCADGDPEVHHVLVNKVFPRQSSVMNAGEWTERLSGIAPVGVQ
jgi:nicotinamidase-related amidase